LFGEFHSLASSRMALSTRVYARIHFLVAPPPVPDLLLFAKHLFIAAIADGDAARLAAVRSVAQVR
jgi:hypothetical protein